MVRQKDVRGEKLMDLIFAVYLHNRSSKDKIKVADLKKTVGYSSAGGVYSAIDSSDYFIRENDEIYLTQKGKEYVKEKILPRFDAYKSHGNSLILLGFFFLVQWFLWTYLEVAIIPPWYLTLLIFGGGFFLRFFVLRLNYFMMKRRKKIEYP